MKVWIDHSKPWTGFAEVLMAEHVGKRVIYASGVAEDGEIVWTTVDANDEIGTFLRLRNEQLEDLAKALGGYVPSTDVTTEALRDAREVRDRLLKLVEDGWANG